MRIALTINAGNVLAPNCIHDSGTINLLKCTLVNSINEWIVSVEDKVYFFSLR